MKHTLAITKNKYSLTNTLWSIETDTILFHKTMSSSNNKNKNTATDTDSNDSSDNDHSNDDEENVLNEVLPVDIACQQHQQPTEGDIHVLTSGIPPIHFLFLPQCYWDNEARECSVDYVISCIPNDTVMENFHSIRLVKSRQLNLC